jgi:flagellar FliJ protein
LAKRSISKIAFRDSTQFLAVVDVGEKVKGFKFSLESVLGYRKSIEDDVRKDFSTLGKILMDTEKILASLRDEYWQSVKGVELMQEGNVNPQELEIHRNFQKNLKARIKTQEDQLKKVKGDWERKRNDLIHASQEKKVLEVLKEKKAEKFRYDSERSNQKEMDDVTSNRFQKGRKG